MRKITLPREFYIPKGAMKISDKHSDAVAYVASSEKASGGIRYQVVVFFGTQAKPVCNFTFGSRRGIEQQIAMSFASRKRHCDYAAKVAAERAAWTNDYKVGEIVNTNWGYEQTNVEHFEIVAVNGKNSVTIRQIAVESYATGSMSDQVTPLPGKYIGEARKVRVSWKGVHAFKGQDFRIATRTRFTEVAGVKVYGTSHTSSYA